MKRLFAMMKVEFLDTSKLVCSHFLSNSNIGDEATVTFNGHLCNLWASMQGPTRAFGVGVFMG